MSKSDRYRFLGFKRQFNRIKQITLLRPSSARGKSLCHYCSELVQYDKSGFYPHFTKVVDLEASAIDCELCLFLWTSLEDEGQDDLERILARFRLGNQITAATGVDKSTIDGETRNVNLTVNMPFRRLATQCSAQSQPHEPCQHGKIMHGKKVAILKSNSTETCSPIWMPDGSKPVDIEKRIPKVLHWMSNCSDSHTKCGFTSGETPKLPTRILDVGLSAGASIRLLISKGQRGKYAALSHCWGSSQPLTTTKATIDSRTSGISMQVLPKTFQHAVQVTRALGLQYLWIDSLCIIQDSRSDWEYEASQMATVYNNAYLTIAGTASSGSQGGLFFLPSPTTLISLDHHARLHARLERNFKDDVLRSPLASRGWTLQESILSRRIIHFASGQLYWECAEMQASEDGLLESEPDREPFPPDVPKMLTSFAPITDVENSGVPSTALRKNWRTIAEAYSRRRLTYPSDKLAALAGIVRQMQALFGDEPIIGLWKNDVLNGLLWVRYFYAAKQMPRDLRIPSWSWLSIDGAIDYCRLRIGKDAKQTMQLLQAEVRWVGAEHTSALQSTSLRVRAKVRGDCILQKMSGSGDHVNRYLVESVEQNSRLLGTCFVDTEMTPVDQPVWCAEIQTRDRHDWTDMAGRGLHTRGYDVLILQPIDLEKRRFVRIGLGEFDQVLTKPHSSSRKEDDPFEGIEPMDFELE